MNSPTPAHTQWLSDRYGGLPDPLDHMLRNMLGDRFTTSAAVRQQHSDGEGYHQSFAPEAVAFPISSEETSEIVRLCAAHSVPIIPFGAGTSLEGNFAALIGGLSIDLSRMDNILRVSVEDMDCTVQAGVTRIALNEHLRDQGLFFPIDPGAVATIGGMASTRASGTNAVRYGTMRENVMALEVVLADGKRITTSRRARKSAAGYDLTRLFVGSEGTLGIVTEITLRLYGTPEAIAAAVCPFETLEGAVRTVMELIQLGIPVARVELLDRAQMRALNAWSKMDHPVRDTLFLEFHGTHAGIAEQIETVNMLASTNGGGDFAWETAAEDRNRLWKARHDALYAAMALRPGCKAWTTDVCVPISRLVECITQTSDDIADSSLQATIVGHVGDGNFHVVFLIDPASADELTEAKRLNGRLIDRALRMDGTCTGEHGIGWGKLDALEAELGDAVDVMRTIKRALDPQLILNPGKVIRMPPG